MKITFVRHSIFNRGGDRIIAGYANYLAQRGHDVCIWVNCIDTIFEISSLVKLNYLRLKSKLGTVIETIFINPHSDLILVDTAPMAFIVSFSRAKRIVYLAQGYDEHYYKKILMRWLVRALYFYALKIKKIPVIAVSAGLADLFYSRFKVKAKVVPNGIDFNEFYPEPSPDLLKDKGARKAVFILARRDYRKGLDIALKVLDNIAKTPVKNDIAVWTIGADISVPGLAVKNFGVVKLEVLRRIFSSADVFLFPSRHEGFGLMALEAMACGCPVLSTPTLGIATDNKDALLIPAQDTEAMADKLLLLLKDRGLGDKLRSHGYDTARRYDFDKSKEGFESACLSFQ